MTFKEYVEHNDPDSISELCKGGVCGCPHQYEELRKYQEQCESNCINAGLVAESYMCEKCWNTEIK